MMTQKRVLAGLIMFMMSLLVACGGGEPTLTFDQALSATQTAVAFQEQLAVAMQATTVANSAATQIANIGTVTKNEEWTPQERDFDGVTMVLVPAGCFMMGSNDAYGEQPVHEQCFDTPFWIDKYEVTQAQFAQFNGQKANANRFTGDNLPVETIIWFEARDFCELRGGRLPTEREWEYAARGPSNLIYPWGNDFVANNVVYVDNSNDQTAPVGSRPDGVSWVGALDMSGNVWEWVSSLYESYPYTSNNESDNDNSSARMRRGGSWVNVVDDGVRSADRDWPDPTLWRDNNGFRCLRSQ